MNTSKFLSISSNKTRERERTRRTRRHTTISMFKHDNLSSVEEVMPERVMIR